jgi:hypothetical protein
MIFRIGKKESKVYKFDGHEVELFDSIHNLPILRMQRYNKYLMQASDIGNTLEDYDEKTLKAVQFLKKGMMTEAIQEFENRRQCVFNALNEFSPQGKAFAVLVKRIDDKEYKDFSPDALDKCLEHLDKIGLGNATSIEKLKEVKKKSKLNFLFTIQKLFQRTETKKLPL